MKKSIIFLIFLLLITFFIVGCQENVAGEAIKFNGQKEVSEEISKQEIDKEIKDDVLNSDIKDKDSINNPIENTKISDELIKEAEISKQENQQLNTLINFQNNYNFNVSVVGLDRPSSFGRVWINLKEASASTWIKHQYPATLSDFVYPNGEEITLLARRIDTSLIGGPEIVSTMFEFANGCTNSYWINATDNVTGLFQFSTQNTPSSRGFFQSFTLLPLETKYLSDGTQVTLQRIENTYTGPTNNLRQSDIYFDVNCN